jgi:hypothetical protein
MKFGRILGLLAVALLAAPFAFADGGTVNMEFTGVNGANNGVYYVSPYYGVMNPGTSSAQNVVLFCDDLANDVYIGETWTANVTNLGSAVNTTNGFANTRYGGVAGSPVFTNSAVGDSPTIAYEEAAWLVSQFASNPGDLVNLQYALWDVMNPGSYWNPDVANWLSLAASNYSNINPYNFEIITNVGNPNLQLTGQVQEFISVVPAPEPGTWAMMLCGALALAIVAIFRSR